MPIVSEIEKHYYGKVAPLDLELLLVSATKKTREFILAHPEYRLSKNQAGKLQTFISRRRRGEPLAYILGYKEFFGLDFKVDRRVLIPRPETELLVEFALEKLRSLLRGKRRNISVIDIGTGSGNIIISILKKLKGSGIEFRRLKLFGIDISGEALSVAKTNARRHQAGKKIELLQGNLLEPIIKKSQIANRKSQILILANLPYLDTGWKKFIRNPETRGLKYEPEKALYAGRDGLDAYRELARQIEAWKPEKAIVLAEIGHYQKRGVGQIFRFAQSLSFHHDLAGKIRLAEIRIQKKTNPPAGGFADLARELN